MLIKEMFEKEIDRDIQGVIIVGQSEAENVAQELDEYVVTTLQISFPHIKRVLSELLLKWVYGFPVSLEVVNLIS